jgi:hypothetical protein
MGGSHNNLKGTVHYEFVLASQTVNSAYYCEVLYRCVKCDKASPLSLSTKELAIASRIGGSLSRQHGVASCQGQRTTSSYGE